MDMQVSNFLCRQYNFFITFVFLEIPLSLLPLLFLTRFYHAIKAKLSYPIYLKVFFLVFSGMEL